MQLAGVGHGYAVVLSADDHGKRGRLIGVEHLRASTGVVERQRRQRARVVDVESVVADARADVLDAHIPKLAPAQAPGVPQDPDAGRALVVIPADQHDGVIDVRILAGVEDAASVGLEGVVGIDADGHGAVVDDRLLGGLDGGDAPLRADEGPGIEAIGVRKGTLARGIPSHVREVRLQHGPIVATLVRVLSTAQVEVGGVAGPFAGATPQAAATDQPLFGEVDDRAIHDRDVGLDRPV